MSLLEKLKAAGSIKVTTLAESAMFNDKDIIPTQIPSINVAFSGMIDGGMVAGLTVLAGPSKHFKSSLGLVMVKAYLDKYDDAICLFYDSEFGITPDYISTFGIDGNRMLHIPLEHVEQLKFDIMKRLEQVDRKDHVVIFIDSIGNLASKKEIDDALDEKSVGDMTRAKQMKSLFRMITPHLTTKNIPCIAVNHIYMTQELYSKPIVSGGCLKAGTKIQMSDDSLKSIEDIKPNDLVKTLFGDKLVTHSWNPDTLLDGTPECFKVEFEDGTYVECSDKHSFLIDGKWVPAHDLSVGLDCSTLQKKEMKITNITKIGKSAVYDISVDEAEHYILENGVVTHNTGITYSANQIFIIGRSQEKDGTDVTGWNFTLNVEKSRFVKEKSKLPIQVSYDGGIDPHSGMQDWAIESGFLVKSGSRYQLVDLTSGEIGEAKLWAKDIPVSFYSDLQKHEKFKDFIKSKYCLTSRKEQVEPDDVSEEDIDD